LDSKSKLNKLNGRGTGYKIVRLTLSRREGKNMLRLHLQGEKMGDLGGGVSKKKEKSPVFGGKERRPNQKTGT